MFTPSSFAVQDQTKLHDLMVAHSFAMLVTPLDARLETLGAGAAAGAEPQATIAVTHLPLLLDRSAGKYGALYGHLAKANPHWQQAAGRRSYAIFSGPHAYISPTWYESQNVVPTWNYVAVHASGTLHLDDSRERRLAIVRQMTDHYEAGMPSPWSLDSQSPEYVERLLAAIVGIRLEIDHVEGKWKLNQNLSSETRHRVAAALADNGGDHEMEMAEMMRQMTMSKDT